MPQYGINVEGPTTPVTPPDYCRPQLLWSFGTVSFIYSFIKIIIVFYFVNIFFKNFRPHRAITYGFPLKVETTPPDSLPYSAAGSCPPGNTPFPRRGQPPP
jgi:hypothetical protein